MYDAGIIEYLSIYKAFCEKHIFLTVLAEGQKILDLLYCPHYISFYFPCRMRNFILRLFCILYFNVYNRHLERLNLNRQLEQLYVVNLDVRYELKSSKKSSKKRMFDTSRSFKSRKRFVSQGCICLQQSFYVYRFQTFLLTSTPFPQRQLFSLSVTGKELRTRGIQGFLCHNMRNNAIHGAPQKFQICSDPRCVDFQRQSILWITNICCPFSEVHMK